MNFLKYYITNSWIFLAFSLATGLVSWFVIAKGQGDYYSVEIWLGLLLFVNVGLLIGRIIEYRKLPK